MTNAIYSSAGFQYDMATETAFNSGTVLADLGAVGIGGKFTSYELDNAWEEVYQIGQRYPQAFYTKGLQAPTTLEFLMCQDQIGWLAFVLGQPTGGTYTVGQTINSGQCKLWTPQNNVFQVGGIVFSQAKIDIVQGAAVDVTLQGIGTSFSASAGTITPGTIPTQLLTWKDCSVSGTVPTSSMVQEVDLTINTGMKQYYALGSAQFQTYLPLASDIQCTIKPFHNDTAYDDIYSAIVNNSTAQGGTVTVNIGTHTVVLQGCYITKGSLNLSPVEMVMDDLEFSVQQLTFV